VPRSSRPSVRLLVTPGLDPGVPCRCGLDPKGVDCRAKPGSRGNEVPAAASGFVETATGNDEMRESGDIEGGDTANDRSVLSVSLW
jgi:hypothetical protein